MEGFRYFMVKVQHKGEIVGHTFISIGYQSFDLRGVFSIVVRNIRFALKLPDESNMPKSPAISHKIENIFVDWQGAFGLNQPLTKLTADNCVAVFGYMDEAKHPYNLEVVFEDREESPPCSSEENMTKDGCVIS